MTAPHTVAGHTAGIADVLDAAADLLTPEGAWTQGEFYTANVNCFCMVGAIGFALGKGKWLGSIATEEWVNRYWPLLAGEDVAGDIEAWNDYPDRTQAEVVAKLREAATAARQSNDMEGDTSRD